MNILNNYHAAIYCRLSKDDDQRGESVSIAAANVKANSADAMFSGKNSSVIRNADLTIQNAVTVNTDSRSFARGDVQLGSNLGLVSLFLTQVYSYAGGTFGANVENTAGKKVKGNSGFCRGAENSLITVVFDNFSQRGKAGYRVFGFGRNSENASAEGFDFVVISASFLHVDAEIELILFSVKAAVLLHQKRFRTAHIHTTHAA